MGENTLSEDLAEAYQEVSLMKSSGEVASYIPELQKVKSDKFGACVTSIDDASCGQGDYDERFSIQSIAKVLSLTLAFKHHGEACWKRVDVEPAGTSFSSLVQLEYESGIPRNPLINSGALVIADMLVSLLDDPKKDFLEFVRLLAKEDTIDYDEKTAASEYSEGYRNFAVINLLRSFGNIENDVEEVLDFYFHLCSITMSCTELSRTFLYLAHGGKDPISGEHILTRSQSKRVNAIMMTCGFYDEAGEFAYEVGLPGKSGVGGGIVAVNPGSYAIAVWSPKLNPQGNSYKGMKFLEKFTTKTGHSIF
ncbi:MAG: glutaminase [Flammeovirgaceae bacterium]|jgi:glutaminase